MGWIFFAAIIAIVIAIAAAEGFKTIAEEKGYQDSSKYFWWTFLIFPVGALMVIALPDRKAAVAVNPVTPKADDDELPEL